MRLVVLVDQRLRVDADGVGDHSHVTPHEEVTAAGVVVILLQAQDDRFPDPGPFADLTHRQASPGASIGQRLADGHATSTSGSG